MMMQGIRKAGQSLIGKVIIFVLFGFLILSFAVWGIGDIFRGYGRNAVATVGKAEIGVEQLRTAYQAEIQNLTRQQRRPITPEMARLLGLDRQVLSRLVTEAVLDQTAARLDLAVSDETVRDLILDDRNFRNASGVFDRARFNELLRANGLNEQTYVREQRGAILRQQIAEGVVGVIQAPGALQEIGHRLRNERRSVAYALMPAASAGEIAAPAEEVLRKFHDERKASFRAPEYRSASLIAISSETLADPARVTEAEARARYEQVKTTRFGTPERRTIQQIAFPTPEEAAAARARIDAGESFDAVAAARGIAEKDLALGTFSRTELFDKAVADAAFAQVEGAVGAPVQGAFGHVLLRVVAIEPARVRAFEEVADELRREIATSGASAQMTDLHDKIEDQRAAAKPLAAIAADLGLPLRAIGPIDSARRTPDGALAEALPGGEAVQGAIFRSDIGVDNEAVRLPRDTGYVWFEVGKIDPPRDRSFDEVRARVLEQWRGDEIAARLSARARELVERLDKGEEFEAVAASAGLAVAQAADLARQGETPELPRGVISLIFGTLAGKANSAASGGDGGRVLFQVRSATLGPFARTTSEADNFARLLASSLSEDILAQYVGKLQGDLGVGINQSAFRNATGGAEN